MGIFKSRPQETSPIDWKCCFWAHSMQAAGFQIQSKSHVEFWKCRLNSIFEWNLLKMLTKYKLKVRFFFLFPSTLLKINACVFRKSLWKEKVLLLVDVVTSQEKLFSRGLFCVEINLNIFSSWFEPNNRKCSRFRPISIMLCKLVQEGQKTFSFYLDDTQSCCWIKKLHPFWKDKQKLLVASFWKRRCYHLPFFFMQKKGTFHWPWMKKKPVLKGF